jgi:hypothetical protein
LTRGRDVRHGATGLARKPLTINCEEKAGMHQDYDLWNHFFVNLPNMELFL